MDKGIWYHGRETALKKGDERTKKIARMGGLASGETRYLKSLRRKQVLKTMADIAYCDYISGVTEEELKAFIKWRHREGTDAPLAEARLKDDDKEATHRYAAQYIRGYEHLKGSSVLKPIKELFQETQEDYDQVLGIMNRAIFRIMEDMQKVHYNPYLCPRGFSKINGYKEVIKEMVG